MIFVPTSTPAPDRGGPVACIGGPIACMKSHGSLRRVSAAPYKVCKALGQKRGLIWPKIQQTKIRVLVFLGFLNVIL